MLDFSLEIRIEYANMAKINKVRAWARKNGAAVQVSRYARDAYEGIVKIHAPWNEGKSETDRKVAELKAILHPKRTCVPAQPVEDDSARSDQRSRR